MTRDVLTEEQKYSLFVALYGQYCDLSVTIRVITLEDFKEQSITTAHLLLKYPGNGICWKGGTYRSLISNHYQSSTVVGVSRDDMIKILNDIFDRWEEYRRILLWL